MEILNGTAGEFFDRALLIGVSSSYSNYSNFNISSDALSCQSNFFNVGQRKVILGRRGGAKDYFRITLLRTVADTSSLVRVEELAQADWPDSEVCPNTF